MYLKRSVKSKIIAQLDGDLPIDELNELSDWINKSKENTKYYTEIKDLWEASVLNASEIAETEKEWKRFNDRISDKKKRELFIYSGNFKTLGKVAAVFIGIIICSSLIIKFFSRTEPIYISYFAPKGSVSQMVLPDSTLIYLNSGTEIKYKIGKSSEGREIFLNGEAWFKVAKEKNKLFTVHTSFYDVNVLGTEFNVKAYESDSKSETTLEKGSVSISSLSNLKMTEKVNMLPGEQFTFNRVDSKLQVNKVNTKLFTSWKENKLIFVNMSLEQLIILIERKYDVSIEVEDKSILSYHYSGTIKNESILEFLNIVKHTMPIQYKIENQKILIRKRR
ncbi:MAG: FecR family protein [Bacteroidales bacterium]|nr:FecR family protein [Bacteroidales bacterium]